MADAQPAGSNELPGATFREALDFHLATLDPLLACVREYAADANHVNRESKEQMKLQEELNDVLRRIYALKDAWATWRGEVRRAAEGRIDRGG
jgi:hypothetical protein